MNLNSTRFFIGLISFSLFQVAVLEFQLENEMPAPEYNTTDFETDLQYPKRHKEKLIETQLNELENSIEDGKITSNLRNQQVHRNLEYNTFFLSERAVEVYTEKEKGHILRKTRSVANNSTALDEQFEQFCSRSQPCTCYYPDHKNIPQFELGVDDLTKNASGLNGTGPGNCQDLKDLGNKLEGFYLVRFNFKRIKTIYCDFSDETVKNTKNQNRNQKDTFPKESYIGRSSKTIIRFCGNFKRKRCNYLYSDHPDAPKMGNITFVRKEPSSCEDLSLIGHILQGFYMVRLNTIKVKVLYCDFKNQITVGNNTGTNTKSISNFHNESQPLYCNGYGSQPCSCYYSNSSILQFELSNDETTRKALIDNGPTSCEDLKTIGYITKGFYMVRFKAKILKTIFCEFHETLMKNDGNHLTLLKSTLKDATSFKKLTTRGSKIEQTLLNEKPPNGIQNPYPNTTTMSSSSIKTIELEDKTTPKQIITEKYIGELSTTVSKSKPQIRQQNYDKNRGTPAVRASEIIPLTRKDGKSYLLKNKRNKCMSWGRLNRHGPYEDNCNTKDTYQHWRWCDDNKICNHKGQFLSQEYIGKYIKPNGKIEKKFHIKLSPLSQFLDQEWRATALGQLVDSKYALCLGVEYNIVDRQRPLIKITSCDEKDDAQFWSFANIWTEVSTPRTTVKSPVTESGKIIPLSQKDGKSYHLMNQHNKCMSSKSINEFEVGAVQSNCNATETRQLWRWSGYSLCSDFGCLSKVQKYAKKFQALLGEENYKSPWVNQNWKPTDEGQLISSSGFCLGAETNSGSHDVLLIVDICDENRKEQIWSFITI